jgi:hypothetical protein
VRSANGTGGKTRDPANEGGLLVGGRSGCVPAIALEGQDFRLVVVRAPFPTDKSHRAFATRTLRIIFDPSLGIEIYLAHGSPLIRRERYRSLSHRRQLRAAVGDVG